jgi:hypothetical protein
MGLALRFFHQRGIISKTPSAKPIPNAVRTTSTNGAFQKVPKKKLTATACWLLSAKAKSVKKMAALSSHKRYFTCKQPYGVSRSIVVSQTSGKCHGFVLAACAVSNASVRASTASRNALPGLKCGTRFSGIATLSPERGLRPMRGGRRLTEKLPKPRISILCPRTSASLTASRMVLTAYSASRCVSWPNRLASSSTRSLRVMKSGSGISQFGDRAHGSFAASSGLSRKTYLLSLSILARSNAPKLVKPELSLADCWLKLAMASC